MQKQWQSLIIFCVVKLATDSAWLQLLFKKINPLSYHIFVILKAFTVKIRFTNGNKRVACLNKRLCQYYIYTRINQHIIT
jgi:hypothetical protein